MVTPTKTLTFGVFEIDMARGELRRSGEPVALEPQVFELLRYIAERPGRVISRDELLDAVWHGRIVSESAIGTRISAARAAVDDNGRDQKVIRTVSRKGILFVPEPSVSETRQTNRSTETGFRQIKPSLVVLPFRDLSDGPAQSYFSEGIAEDILTSLARFDELVVIARQSAFAFDGASSDALQFSTSLGVEYALEGSVQRSDDRVRVSARLVEVVSRATLWAGKFDRDVGDIFAVQDEISGAIVNALVGEVSDHRVVKVQSRAPRNMGAYDHALRAQQLAWTVSRDAMSAARAAAKSAIDLEPDFARAHALLSWVALTEDGNGWGKTGQYQFDESVSHARIAVALDDKNPWAHSLLGTSVFWRDRDVPYALSECRFGVDLNPSNAHIRMFLGACLAYSGDGASAIDELDAAIDLNPLYPSLYLMHRARAHFVLEDFKSALEDMERAAASLSKHPGAHAMLAACLEAMGRHEEAHEAIQTVSALSPHFTSAYARKTLPYTRDSDLERFCALVTAAGLTR